MATNMTIKGQVLIPKHVREATGLVPGKPVNVVLNEAGEAVVRPVADDAASLEVRRAEMRARIDRVAGICADGESTNKFMTRIREDVR